MRRHAEQDYLTLKARLRDLVALCGGPQRACELTRGSASRMSEAMAPHLTERFPAIDQVYDLERECGEPRITRFMAEQLGFDLVPMASRPPEQNLHHQLARIVIECADAQSAIARALDDGRVDDRERTSVLVEIGQAIEQLQNLKAALQPTSLRSVK